MYCHLDDYTHAVISEHTGSLETRDIKYQYFAPVKIPENFKVDGLDFEIIDDYLYLNPTNVGAKAYEVQSEDGDDYKINHKVYYITTALSDTWMNFTMPFDVENIYVVESYPDNKLVEYFETQEEYDPEEGNFFHSLGGGAYTATRLLQGKHNADFASFFGMAMALGSDATFEEMQQDFLDWAYLQDTSEDLPDGERYTGTRNAYDWRGVWPLTHYDGSNFTTANFYLYTSNGDWEVEMQDGYPNSYVTDWQIVPKREPNKPLLRKGQNYSMLFPYCWGCDIDETRSYWDYWTGKFLIFESTQADANQPHEISGKNGMLTDFEDVPSLNARLAGNSSFAKISYTDYEREDIFLYKSYRSGGEFVPLTEEVDLEVEGNIITQIENHTIYPTNSVLLTSELEPLNVKSIRRDGKIVYGAGGNNNGNPDDDVTTGTLVPTVGGGNDMFITAIDGGINVAVTAPQMVCVVNATGHILYNGFVTTDVNVILPVSGIYVVKGENEVQKIFL